MPPDWIAYCIKKGGESETSKRRKNGNGEWWEGARDGILRWEWVSAASGLRREGILAPGGRTADLRLEISETPPTLEGGAIVGSSQLCGDAESLLWRRCLAGARTGVSPILSGTFPASLNDILTCALVPKIGHLKSDHRVGRCFLSGLMGDAINIVLAAAGSNLRKLLRRFVFALRRWLGYLADTIPMHPHPMRAAA